MSSWLILAISAQIAGSIAIYSDKIALSDFVRSPHAVFLISGSFNLLTACMLAAAVGLPHLDRADLASAAGAGICFVLHLLLYFKALFRCSALSTAVLFQLVPVFSLLLGLATHDASVTLGATGAIVLVVIGAVTFSLAERIGPNDADASGSTATDGDGSTLEALRYMVPATLLLAVSGLLMHRVAAPFGQSLTVSLFAAGVAVPLVAICMRFLGTAIAEVRSLPTSAFIPVALAEASAFGYQLLTFAALSRGPAPHVFAIEGVQPLILLVIGGLIAWIAPRFSTETLSLKVVSARTASATLIIAGVILLAAQDAA